jgi:hypothetical protein
VADLDARQQAGERRSLDCRTDRDSYFGGVVELCATALARRAYCKGLIVEIEPRLEHFAVEIKRGRPLSKIPVLSLTTAFIPSSTCLT